MSKILINTLSEFAEENGIYPVTLTFKDADGDEVEAAAIQSITWRLIDADGNTINSRVDQSLTPASPATVILEGNDLAITTGFTGRSEERRLGVKVVFNSTLGNGKTQTGEVRFYIKNQLWFPIL